MTLSIKQLPVIDLDAAFASRDAFDEIIISAHERGPFAQSNRGLEIIGYREFAVLLRDRRLNADHMALVNAMGFPEGPARDFKQNMLLSHGRDEYRTRIRQALMRAIGPSVIEKQRPMIRQLAKDLLLKIDPNEEADFLHEFAFLLPASLFCLWFGAPLEDARWVGDVSDRLLKIFSFNPKYTPEIVAAYDELFPYVRKRIDAAKENPEDNLLAEFIAQHKEGFIDETELFYIVSMFNEASTDNTAHGIATAVGDLLGNQERWQQIVDHPALIPAAVNENMRLSGRINTLVRYASETFEYEGLEIPAGTAVHHVMPAAHRDPRTYSDPLRYDPTRKTVQNILDFGGGIYTCLGKFVALIEIQEAIAELAGNYPNARLNSFSIATNPFVNEVSDLKTQLHVN